MKVRPAALIVRDNKVLLMAYEYGGKKVHMFPGGNPDPGETLDQTVVRELEEELGVTARIHRPLLTGEVLNFRDKEDTLHFLFEASIGDQEPVLNPAQTSAKGLEWVEIADLKELNLYPNFGVHIVASMSNLEYVGDLKQKFFE